MRIALIYQKTNFPFIFEDAIRLGVEIVLIHRPGESPNPPGISHMHALDIAAPSAFETLRALHERYQFDGLLTLWEGAVPFVAQAAAHLGLPGVPYQAAVITRDKAAVREVLRENGLNCPSFARLHDPRQLCEFDLGFPAVVKPACGFGSLGVVRANDSDELENAVNTVFAINSNRLADYQHGEEVLLIERYLDGPEYVAETIAVDGEVRVLSIGYKGRPQGPYFEESIYIAQARLAPAVRRAIEEQVIKATLALGITHGPTHTELRLDDEGKPYVLEIGARLGGSGAVARMVYRSTGIDYTDLVFKSAAGRLRMEDIPVAAENGVHSFYIIPVGDGGIIESFDGLSELMDDPCTEQFVQFTDVGGVLAPYPDFSGYAGMVFAHHHDYDSATRYIEQAKQSLKVRYSVPDVYRRSKPPISDDELMRYSRQMLLPQIGAEGQHRLRHARVLLIGLGGLGSPVATYLVGAGIGTLILIDSDTVDISNLHRQTLFKTTDVGKPKPMAAAERLTSVNPHVEVKPIFTTLDEMRLEEEIGDVDLVVDASDNFSTRFAINRVCARARIPLVTAAGIRMEGVVCVFRHDRPEQACYRCIYPDTYQPVDSCNTNGVLGPLVGAVGAIQAAEAIRVLTERDGGLDGKMLVLDAMSWHFNIMMLERNSNCPVCTTKASTERMVS